MFKILPVIKIIIYAMVFIRVFRETPPSFPLVLLALALVVSGFWRKFYGYERPKGEVFYLAGPNNSISWGAGR